MAKLTLTQALCVAHVGWETPFEKELFDKANDIIYIEAKRLRLGKKKERIYVTDIKMSVRLLNVLKASKYNSKYALEMTYIDEFSNYTRKEVSRQRNLGVGCMRELEEIMAKYDVKFKGE
jgi:hypothetical protein